MTQLRTLAVKSVRSAWPHSFEKGTYVRHIHDGRWGCVIGPAGSEDRWLIQYSLGARVVAAAENFAPFDPTAGQKQEMENRFPELAKADGPIWPEQYVT